MNTTAFGQKTNPNFTKFQPEQTLPSGKNSNDRSSSLSMKATKAIKGYLLESSLPQLLGASFLVPSGLPGFEIYTQKEHALLICLALSYKLEGIPHGNPMCIVSIHVQIRQQSCKSHWIIGQVSRMPFHLHGSTTGFG